MLQRARFNQVPMRDSRIRKYQAIGKAEGNYWIIGKQCDRAETEHIAETFRRAMHTVYRLIRVYAVFRIMCKRRIIYENELSP